MAALFKCGQRPGPIAPFKTWPKTDTLGCVLNVAISLGPGPHFKRGLRP